MASASSQQVCTWIPGVVKKETVAHAVQDARVIPGTSLLLELPGEVRNRIFRHVLVSDDEIPIDKTNFKQPTLLRTCKTIKNEASPIYYHENSFRFCVELHDSTAMTSWWQHAKSSRKGGIRGTTDYHIDDLSGCSWSNLLTWLRRFHAGMIPGFLEMHLIASDDSIDAQLVTLFRVAGVMRGLPWETVVKVLEAQKDLLDHLGVERIVEDKAPDE